MAELLTTDEAATYLRLSERKLYELAPGLIERTDTSAPMWWPVIGGPALAALGSLAGSRRLASGPDVPYCLDLAPLYLNAAAAKEALPGVQEAIKKMASPRPDARRNLLI